MFCDQCGSSFSAIGSYCSNCGAGRGGATTTTVKPRAVASGSIPRNKLSNQNSLTPVEQLEKYAQLREKNLIDDHEYAEAKARLLEPDVLLQVGYSSRHHGYRQGGSWTEELRESWVYAVVAFLIPIIGLVMWVKWNDERPLDAKWAGIGAAIGVVAYLIATPVFVYNVFYYW